MRTILFGVLLIFGLTAFSQSYSTKAYDYIPDVSYEEIADRLACLETEIPLEFNEKVKGFIDYFTIKDRNYTREFLRKTDLYFPIFDAAFEKYNVPKELKYLAIVESGLRPHAVSRANAVGLWQFMSGTGRMYGLSNDWYIDDRMDPVAASDAAARHLRDLYDMFGDWELALAAYNCGAGNVRKAIRRSDYKNSFWQIYPYLPRETRSYVPQFVAICYTVNYAQEHNLFPEEVVRTADSDTIMVSQYLHLETFASNLNLCLDDLLMLNPGVKRGALPEGTKEYALRVPEHLKPVIEENRTFLYDTASKVGKDQLDYLAKNLPGSTYGRVKEVYKVRSGDVLGSIAQKYHVRVTDLKEWNRIEGNMIRTGQYLTIWVLPVYNNQTKDLYTSTARTSTTAQISKPVTSAAPVATTDPTGKKYHQVKAGETLWAIANSYSGLSIEKIKQLNNLRSNTIQPGQRLIISE